MADDNVKPGFKRVHLRYRDPSGRYVPVGWVDLEIRNYEIHVVEGETLSTPLSELAGKGHDSVRLYENTGESRLLLKGKVEIYQGNFHFIKTYYKVEKGQ